MWILQQFDWISFLWWVKKIFFFEFLKGSWKWEIRRIRGISLMCCLFHFISHIVINLFNVCNLLGKSLNFAETVYWCFILIFSWFGIFLFQFRRFRYTEKNLLVVSNSLFAICKWVLIANFRIWDFPCLKISYLR